LTKRNFALMPVFGQVFVKGRRPFWPKENFALMPDFGQVFVKGRRPFWPKENFALMPDFGQVFVKGEGLFGCRGRFKLPLPMAGALKGPVVFVYRILRRHSWPLSVLCSLRRYFGELPLYTCRGFLY
jgi:hypothetical protein